MTDIGFLNMTDLIAGAVVLLLVILAVRYLRKAKKNGAACIGCSHGCNCGEKKQEESACCCCHSAKEE